MLTHVKTITTAAVLATALAACSSTPSWEGMSQADIAGWKALGLDAAAAQVYVHEGFNLATATPWVQAGIGPETADEWASEEFTADEALAWRNGGFDLDEAKKNRAKGLSPVQ